MQTKLKASAVAIFSVSLFFFAIAGCTPKDPNGTCVDGRCVCNPGFGGQFGSCLDIDECAGGVAGCDVNATCANTVGSRTCSCRPGYKGDGTSCTDINECEVATSCDLNASCTNAPGAFSCACKSGFTGDGKKCTDIDECATDHGGCADNETCTNTPGSRTCACARGYAGVVGACADIDECQTNRGGCAVNAQCLNVFGSYSCTCQPGYVGDGMTCTPGWTTNDLLRRASRRGALRRPRRSRHSPRPLGVERRVVEATGRWPGTDRPHLGQPPTNGVGQRPLEAGAPG